LTDPALGSCIRLSAVDFLFLLHKISGHAIKDIVMNNEEILIQSHLRADIPQIRPGDTVKVQQKIKEGDKERISMFEGLVIAAKHGRGITGTFTVRKMIDGIGVERVFPLHMPMIAKIDVIRRSHVRRAKLYYIRDKAAREVRKKMKLLHEAPTPVAIEAPVE